MLCHYIFENQVSDFFDCFVIFVKIWQFFPKGFDQGLWEFLQLILIALGDLQLNKSVIKVMKL